MYQSQLNPRKIIDDKILKIHKHTKVQQVGIDLTVSEFIELPQGHAYNVLLNEIVELPDDVYAMLYGRSSYNREGVLIRGSVYDPGYKGQVGCTIYNMSGNFLKIKPNERICQMMFFRADPASKYDGQYQSEHLYTKCKTRL